MARPSGPVRATDAGVSIDYNNCGVASVTNASDVDSLSVYYADTDGARHRETGIDPTIGDQQQYRPIIIQYSSGSDKTNIKLTESGGSIVHVVAKWGDDGRVSRTNPDQRRCVPDGFNVPPEVSFTVKSAAGEATSDDRGVEVPPNEPVTFRTGAEDPDEPEELRYDWTLSGDPTLEESGKKFSATFETIGPRTVTHRVTDDIDEWSEAELVFTVVSGEWRQVHELVPDDQAPGARFGHSVAAAGETVVVGAPFAMGSSEPGAAYVFDLAGSTPTRQPVARDQPTGGDLFGYSVAVSDATAVVGSPKSEPGGVRSGAAYVCDPLDPSTSQPMPVPDGVERGDFYGYSVAISRDRAVVGSITAGDFGTGAAYVYDKPTGGSSAPTELVPGGLEMADQFGYSAAVAGDTVVVGAPFSGDDGMHSGDAYVADLRPSPPTTTKLAPGQSATDDEFGTSVAISGDTAVVGAPGADGGTVAAAVFDLAGSSPTSPTFDLDVPTDAAGFGAAVAVSGTTAVIGAPSGGDGGAAYVFDLSDDPPTRTQLPAPSDLEAGDEFGTSVAISGGTIVVGASQVDGAGAAYVYER